MRDRGHGHDLPEARSLALHRAVGDELESRPEILIRARSRVGGWLSDGSVHRRYAESWRDLLSLPLAELRDRLVDEGEEMTALRQCTPFAGALDPRTRWRIWRRVGREAPSHP